MKYITTYLGENKIEFFNTFLGKETIKVNDEIVSEKSSLFGTEHNFTINENGNEVPCKLTTGVSIYGVVFNLYKNDNPIIEMPKKSKAAFLLIIIIAVVTFGILKRYFS